MKRLIFLLFILSQIIFAEKVELMFNNEKILIEEKVINGIAYMPLHNFTKLYYKINKRNYKKGDKYVIKEEEKKLIPIFELSNFDSLIYKGKERYLIFKDNHKAYEKFVGRENELSKIDKKLTKELKEYTLRKLLELYEEKYPMKKEKNLIVKNKEIYINSKKNVDFYFFINRILINLYDSHTNISFAGHSYEKNYIAFAQRRLYSSFIDYNFEEGKFYFLDFITKKKSELLEINSKNVFEYQNYLYLKNKTEDIDFSKVKNYMYKNIKELTLKDSNGKIFIRKSPKRKSYEIKKITEEIGYISFAYFNKELYEKVKENLDKVKDSKFIILDLRDNKGGKINLGEDLLSYIAKDKDFKIFTLNNNYLAIQEEIYGNSIWSGKEIIILSNKFSYSTTNNVLLSVKENNLGTIIGEKSGGGAYEVYVYTLPDNTIIQMSGALMSCTKSKKILENGVEPDIYARGDNILEQALDYIEENYKK